MSEKMTNNYESRIKIERDRELDLFIAHVREITNPLETRVVPLFDGNILFKIDSVTNEPVQVFIYDFSVVRRKLLTKLVFVYTTGAVENWISMLIAAFKAGKKTDTLAPVNSC
ncbi:MAG: hypothetical protein DRI57_32875 [Deltaproteobacteria bacterium]|nr:MAG: hypothetical protein DRI57_32875 [Deltaproteobacteria bacterium]